MMYKSTAVISLLSLLVSQGVFSAPNPDEGLGYMRPEVAKPVNVAKSEPEFESNGPEALGNYEDTYAPEAAEEALEEVGEELTEPEKLNDNEDNNGSETLDDSKSPKATRASKVFARPNIKPDNSKATRASKVFKKPTKAQASKENIDNPENANAESSAEGAGNADTKEKSDNYSGELEGGDPENYDDDEDYQNKTSDEKTDAANVPDNKESESNEDIKDSDEQESDPNIISDPEESSENNKEKPELSSKRPDSKSEDDKSIGELDENAEGAGKSEPEDSSDEPEPTTSSESDSEYTNESKTVEPSDSSAEPEETGKPESDSNHPEEDSNGEGNAEENDNSSALDSSSSATSSSEKVKETNEPELAYKRPENKSDKNDANSGDKEGSKKDESYLDSFKGWYKKTFQ